ncbi:MAG TPA: hypothetical protein VI814_06260 [Candidatus Limnocylindria bacterium]
MGTKLIAYECVAPDHHAGDEPDRLTIHDGAWAFCGAGIRRDGHQWRETGGQAYEELLRKAGVALTPGAP